MITLPKVEGKFINHQKIGQIEYADDLKIGTPSVFHRDVRLHPVEKTSASEMVL